MNIHTQHIELNGHRYLCLVAGNPQHPAILMVHGWAHHPDIWTSTIEAFCDRYYCVAVGVLGLGDCDKPADGDYRIEAQARQTLALADALGIDRFVLIGQSRGGQIALCLAAQIAPERVVKLVDISGVCSGQVAPYLKWMMWLLVWMSSWLPWMYHAAHWLVQFEPVANRFYAPYFANMRRAPKGMAIRDLKRGTRVEAHISNLRTLNSLMGTDLRPYLHRITVPTLILFGADDMIVPPVEALAAHALIPNSELVMVDQCGHYPMIEQPAQYLAALRRFLG